MNLTVNNYNLTMKCIPDDDRLYKYTWIKKNDVLPLRAQGINSSHLTIVNLTPKDSGDYQCVLSNGTGSISSTVKIIGSQLCNKNVL